MGALSQKTGTKSFVISGDFNTPPDYPAYAFIKDGYMSDLTRKSAEQKTDTKGILTPVSIIVFIIQCQILSFGGLGIYDSIQILTMQNKVMRKM